MKRDLTITFLTEMLVLTSGILVYKFAAVILGKNGFSEFALCKRIIAMILPTVLLGLGVAIPRYIAFAGGNINSSIKADDYFVGGMILLLISLISLLSVANLFSGIVAYLLLGSRQYTYLIFPISLVLLGSVLHLLCYGYYRGKLMMVKANIVQIINLAIVPAAAFFMANTTAKVLVIAGLSLISTSSILLVFILRNIDCRSLKLIQAAREIFIYGIQRVPGDIALAALFALPATIIAHISGVNKAGSVAFATSLLNMVGAIYAPIGLILLPKASKIIASKDFKQLKYYISKILKITLFLSLCGVMFYEIFAEKIILLYLGEGFSDVIYATRILMIGSIAYNVYVSMRSIIDAYYVKAVNTCNIIATLFVFLTGASLSTIISPNHSNLVISFIIALFVLGGLTLWEIKKILLVEKPI